MASPATYAVFAPIVLLVLYRRFRRNFGRQPLSAPRLWLRVAGLCIATAALLLIGTTGMLVGAQTGIAAIAGLCAGVALSVVGLRRTRFEQAAGARWYTPDPWIGGALAALMLGRLAYRFVKVRALSDIALQDPSMLSTLHRSPLTLAIAALLVGYWLGYCIGLLRKARAPQATPA